MSGTNDHPTPVQYLLSNNTLEFLNLAKSSASENGSSGLLSSLLSVNDFKERVTKKKYKCVDNLLDIGKQCSVPVKWTTAARQQKEVTPG